MKRFALIMTLALVALAWSGPVRAQDAPTLASLEISLWPEFDRSELLAIYRGELDAAVPLPAAVEIAIPARVGQPTAVAYVDEAGQRLTQQYTTRIEGERLIVAFSLITPRFQLEYYDALPSDSAGKRTYTFAFTADYAIAALNLEFQMPPTAMGLGLDPPADTSVVGQEGLTYHLRQVGALAAGDTREWTFSYVKTDTALTAASLAPAPTATPTAAGGTGDSTVWLFVVAFVALIAVGVTGFWLGNRAQPAPVPAARQPQKRRGSGRGERPRQMPRHMPAQRQMQPLPTANGEARFCHQCGSELRPDSAFCHVCGTSVRGR